MTRLTLSIVLLTAFSQGLAQSDLSEGIQFFENEKLSEAKTFFESHIKQNNKDAAANYYLGRIYLAEKNFKDAKESLETAIKNDDTNPQYHFWFAQSCMGRIDEVGALKKMGLAKKARKACEKAIKLDPEYMDAMTWLFGFYLNAPGIAGGGIDKATALANEIKNIDPLMGHRTFVQIYRKEKKYDLLENEIHAVLALEPEDLEVQYTLGYAYVDQEKYEEAFNQFESMIASAPEEWNAYYQVGRTAAISGQNLERGQACMNTFLQQETQEGMLAKSSAHWRLGMIYEHRSDKASALAEYREALASDPEHKEVKKALKSLQGN